MSNRIIKSPTSQSVQIYDESGNLITITDEKISTPLLQLNPQSSDPSSPSVGTLQYADGTSRVEGLWEYKSTGWTVVGSGGGGGTGSGGYTTVITTNIISATSGTWNTGVNGNPVFSARYWDNTNNVFDIYNVESLYLTANLAGNTITYDASSVTFLTVNDYIELKAAYFNGSGSSGGSAAGGISLIWRNDDTLACGEVTSDGELAYTFTAGDTQNLYTAIKVPSTYTSGQVKLLLKIYSPGLGNVLLQATSTLINSTSSNIFDTANQRVSTNIAQSISVANKEYLITLDITDATGKINTTIAPNDTILISLSRSTDTNPDLVYFMPATTEVLGFQGSGSGGSGSQGVTGLQGIQGMTGISGFTGVQGTTGVAADLILNSTIYSSYILAITDRNKMIIYNSGSAGSITVPLNSAVAFPIGTQVAFFQVSTGQLTISPYSGVTIYTENGYNLNAQYSLAAILKIDTDTWVLTGALKA